jgi:signal transduction histidine kinase
MNSIERSELELAQGALRIAHLERELIDCRRDSAKSLHDRHDEPIEISAPRIRVLLIEDDEVDYLLASKCLLNNTGTAFDVSWVRSYDSALEELRNPYDVCLVDRRLGAKGGPALILQATAEGFHGPMILLTGVDDQALRVTAMTSGAADCVEKAQLTPQLIERVIRHALERKSSDAALCRSEEKLRRSEKMESVGRVAGGLVHDINNLLSVILSYSELLTADLMADDPARADLVRINEAGLRAADLTAQFSAFSRQQVLQPRTIDLNKIFAQMEDMVRRVIGADVELISLVDPLLFEINGDPSQMEQVIMNLVCNARDAMPNGGKLTVETARVLLSPEQATEHSGVKVGPHVLLNVTDTGTGMDKATQAHIFEPYFTTKVIGKGTGLGLSTVFGIVKQSYGAIWAVSEPNKGATFTVCLPAVTTSQASRVSLPPEAAVAITLQGSETVLLVADDDRVRVLAGTILRKYGYCVLEAQSSGDALIVCEQHPARIDLLMTDIVMPRISGPQLAARLIARRPEMKVLYIAGYAGAENLQLPLLGTRGTCLQTPITPAALAHGVREALLMPLPTSPQTSPFS